MTMNLIAIGVDNSTTLTGLSMYRFNADNERKFIKASTIETPDYYTMRDQLCAFIGMDYPTIVTLEDAFFGKNPAAGKKIHESAIWAKCTILQYFPLIIEKVYLVTAREWRESLWGKGKGWMQTGDAKDYSIAFVATEGLKTNCDHKADAGCLTLWGIKEYNGGSK